MQPEIDTVPAREDAIADEDRTAEPGSPSAAAREGLRSVPAAAGSSPRPGVATTTTATTAETAVAAKRTAGAVRVSASTAAESPFAAEVLVAGVRRRHLGRRPASTGAWPTRLSRIERVARAGDRPTRSAGSSEIAPSAPRPAARVVVVLRNRVELSAAAAAAAVVVRGSERAPGAAATARGGSGEGDVLENDRAAVHEDAPSHSRSSSASIRPEVLALPSVSPSPDAIGDRQVRQENRPARNEERSEVARGRDVVPAADRELGRSRPDDEEVLVDQDSPARQLNRAGAGGEREVDDVTGRCGRHRGPKRTGAAVGVAGHRQHRGIRECHRDEEKAEEERG